MAIDNLSEWIDEEFEERADYVDESVLESRTVTSDYFGHIQGLLTRKGLVLLEGPRGCGKTHMMRYAWLQCVNDASSPMPVFVSFNRYLRLEPLLKQRSDGLTLFQIWILLRILVSIQDCLSRISPDETLGVGEWVGVPLDEMRAAISQLERSQTPDGPNSDELLSISIEQVQDVIGRALRTSGRTRSILLMDDAALTLTPSFLIEFFDIVRTIKRSNISPKISVYPGTTQYGPRFHASHEGHVESIWLSVDDDRFLRDMLRMAELRIPTVSEGVREELKKVFAYASFGIPRAFLTMMRDYSSSKGSTASYLETIRSHNRGRIEEFRSLSIKLPQMSSVIDTGVVVFDQFVDLLRDANKPPSQEPHKRSVIGIEKGSVDTIAERMFSLLIEAGLLQQFAEVSHGGKDRVYLRYNVHMASLIADRVFTSESRGSSAQHLLTAISRPQAKHPVRRGLSTILTNEEFSKLQLDLAECQNCRTPRLNEQQRFCHNCGQKLIDDSTYSRVMQVSLRDVPTLTPWQRRRISDIGLETVGDLHAIRDPGSELRKLRYVGQKRAETIIRKVEAYVDEFLY